MCLMMLSRRSGFYFRIIFFFHCDLCVIVITAVLTVSSEAQLILFLSSVEFL